jgi:hypothetical protein
MSKMKGSLCVLKTIHRSIFVYRVRMKRKEKIIAMITLQIKEVCAY